MRAALATIAVTGALTGCVKSLDHRAIDAAGSDARLCEITTDVESCVEAASESSFSYVAAQILEPKCALSNSCHQGGAIGANLDFRTPDAAYAGLVDQPSMLEPSYMLVVPGNSKASLLSVMIGQIAPDQADPPLAALPTGPDGEYVGQMPQSSPPLCCQKVDAIAAWIDSGAANM